MGTDPRKGHPGYTPTDPPQMRVGGAPIRPQRAPPVEPENTPEPSAKPRRHTARNVGAGAAAVAVVGALMAGLPPVIEAMRKSDPPPKPETREHGEWHGATYATQAAVDAAHARITVLERRVQLLSELACAQNEGSPGPGWPCDVAAYPPPRDPPPRHRTDKVFPE